MVRAISSATGSLPPSTEKVQKETEGSIYGRHPEHRSSSEHAPAICSRRGNGRGHRPARGTVLPGFRHGHRAAHPVSGRDRIRDDRHRARSAPHTPHPADNHLARALGVRFSVSVGADNADSPSLAPARTASHSPGEYQGGAGEVREVADAADIRRIITENAALITPNRGCPVAAAGTERISHAVGRGSAHRGDLRHARLDRYTILLARSIEREENDSGSVRAGTTLTAFPHAVNGAEDARASATGRTPRPMTCGLPIPPRSSAAGHHPGWTRPPVLHTPRPRPRSAVRPPEYQPAGPGNHRDHRVRRWRGPAPRYRRPDLPAGW